MDEMKFSFSRIKRFKGTFVLFIFGIYMFSGCVNTRLPRKVTVKIAWSDSLIGGDTTGTWAYSKKELFKMIDAQFKIAFSETGQFELVDTNPDYIFRVDSVNVSSSTRIERHEAPCQKQRSFVGAMVFDFLVIYDTFRISTSELHVYANLSGVNSKNETNLNMKGWGTEQLVQEPKLSTDSVNCNPYYVEGNADAKSMLNNLRHTVTVNVKHHIRKWERGKRMNFTF